jgi:hypothetical protein
VSRDAALKAWLEAAGNGWSSMQSSPPPRRVQVINDRTGQVRPDGQAATLLFRTASASTRRFGALGFEQ